MEHTTSLQIPGQFPTPDGQPTAGTNLPNVYTTTTPVYYVFPPFEQPRVRRAAHLLDADYVSKYERAVKLLKDLPDGDPRKFYLHGADEGHKHHLGLADAEDDHVHGSWLFFPWHRIHLYFYERVLADLLGDESFAIPFWNWDHTDGMQVPPMYAETEPSQYPRRRRRRSNPGATTVIDFSGAGTDPDDDLDPARRIENNLAFLARAMNGAKSAELFMGAKNRTDGGVHSPGAGSRMVAGLQTSICDRLFDDGEPETDVGQDMGNFYSSGRDYTFYGLHANADRMWDIWSKTTGGRSFTDDEFVAAAFYFYDEKKRLVRVRVSDVLDREKLGYTYETRELPWRYVSPRPGRYSPSAEKAVWETKMAGEFPLELTSTVKVAVERPKKARGDDEEEVLVIGEIEQVGQKKDVLDCRFDVFVNAAAEAWGLTPSAAEFAGSFSSLPRRKLLQGSTAGGGVAITNLRLGLSELLREVGAEEDEAIEVTLVPRKGAGKIKIGGVGIQHIKIK